MRFLCFHGIGTNGKIFEAQTARLRQALGRQHEFVFLTGTVPVDPALDAMLNMRIGTESAFGGAYRFGGQDQAQLCQMYEGLLRIIRVQGPFDGVFGAALAANPMAVGRGMRNIVLGTSLTHNVSFHDPQVRVDEWIVLERDTTWGADGRVLVSQRMWDMKSGRLILSGSQEALVRLRDKNSRKPKL